MKIHHNISFSIIGCSCFALICLFSQTRSAYADTNLTVSPLIQALTITSASQSANISVINNSSHSLTFSLNLLPFKQSYYYSDKPIIGSKKEFLSSFYLKQINITINNQPIQSFTLPSHSSQELQVHIPPQNNTHTPKDYYFCLLLTADNAKTSSATAQNSEIDAYLNQNISIGSLFLLSPSRTILGTLLAPKIDRVNQSYLNYNSQIKGNFILHNPNNTYLNISINIIRKNLLGQIIDKTKLPQSFMLATGTNKFSYDLSTRNEIGLESLTFKVNDLHSGNSISYTKQIILIPLKLAIYVIVTLLTCVYIGYKIKVRLTTI